MSGRDVEPVTAFFPSIDRNLLRDLDRHLRVPETAEPEALVAPAKDMAIPLAPPLAPRPTADTLVEAIQHAAATMSAMTDRIEELESSLDALERTHHDTVSQFQETQQLLEASEAALREESERRDRAETLAAHHVARANRLDLELANALGDLTRVTDAIAGALGFPERDERDR